MLDKFKEELQRHGYIIPTGAKFWKSERIRDKGAIGMQVGSYTHSCHIDVTDFIVLLLANGEVKKYDSFWLTEI